MANIWHTFDMNENIVTQVNEQLQITYPDFAMTIHMHDVLTACPQCGTYMLIQSADHHYCTNSSSPYVYSKHFIVAHRELASGGTRLIDP